MKTRGKKQPLRLEGVGFKINHLGGKIDTLTFRAVFFVSKLCPKGEVGTPAFHLCHVQTKLTFKWQRAKVYVDSLMFRKFLCTYQYR